VLPVQVATQVTVNKLTLGILPETKAELKPLLLETTKKIKETIELTNEN